MKPTRFSVAARVTLLDRYFGAGMISTLFRTIVSLVLLFVLVDFLTQQRNTFMKHDVPWRVMMEYYAFSIPKILSKYQITSLATLASALFIFGNAAQNNEITAALAGGISLRRIARAPICIAAVLSVGMFLLEDTVGASANKRLDQLETRYFPNYQEKERPGTSWPYLRNGWTCHIMKFNRAALTGERVLMHSFREDAVEQITANRIYWDETVNKWVIEDGGWIVLDPKKEWQGPVNRVTRQYAPIEETPEELFALDKPPETKSLMALAADIGKAKSRGIPVNGHWTDFYAKLSEPALCFIMIFLAIPFSIRLNRGGVAIGLGVSVGIAILYLVLSRVAIGLGHVEQLPPFVAAWVTNALFFCIGLILLKTTPT
jgi:lipopolysaccharide export system permease protein